jgi:capsular exopolysaccharide synthesis family protein
MDLRAPKILEYLTLQDLEGVTNYIISDEVSVEKYILKNHDSIGFDILPSGDIPPNPAELLMNDKISTLFENLRNIYDYIIVDTAPVAPVTDTLLISKYSDAILYVTKQGYLDKRLLQITSDLYKDGKLPNLGMILNGTKNNRGYGYGYGNAYGYGYGNNVTKNNKNIFRRILNL